MYVMNACDTEAQRTQTDNMDDKIFDHSHTDLIIAEFTQDKDVCIYFVFVACYQWLCMDSIRSVVHDCHKFVIKNVSVTR